MKLITLLSVCSAAVLVSSSSPPTLTPTPSSTLTAAPTPTSAVAELAKSSDCTTSSVKLQQFNNNMTSTTYLKTRTKTREYDCNGCHHFATSWIGYRPPFHHQPTTVTVKKTTTTVGVCKTSPTPQPSKVLGAADAETKGNETQDAETQENETQDAETTEIEIPEIKAPEVETPEIETQEVNTPELEAQEFEIPERVEVVDF